jgi:competence CoiA-like predicted nuclease
MFKALNRQSGKEVIILDPEWEERVDHLRSLDRKDLLVCQHCKQPARVRAGKIRRWHFAHKHLKDCPLQHESSTLLVARAILYKWLASKFEASAVTLEKELDQDFLPRPVDCWVEARKKRFAYWIVESQVEFPIPTNATTAAWCH